MENVKIKNIPLSDRPRERLISIGAKNLSNEELLSILLNSGSKNVSVKNISSVILSKAGGINKLKKLDYNDLIKIKGVGNVKACLVLALIELSKRMNRKVDNLTNVKLNEPAKVFEFYKSRVDSFQEQFYCIYLDAKKRVIKDKLLFIGTVNHSLVHPRDIFKLAYSLNAAFIICVHNHPSGDVMPSIEDDNVTVRLNDIGKLMGIKLLDHVIVSESNYYSFLENGRI